MKYPGIMRGQRQSAIAQSISQKWIIELSGSHSIYLPDPHQNSEPRLKSSMSARTNRSRLSRSQIANTEWNEMLQTPMHVTMRSKGMVLEMHLISRSVRLIAKRVR
jgi:hypothetical protein